jgi:hypothetical protein
LDKEPLPYPILFAWAETLGGCALAIQTMYQYKDVLALEDLAGLIGATYFLVKGLENEKKANGDVPLYLRLKPIVPKPNERW